jgi:hypothetical protein
MIVGAGHRFIILSGNAHILQGPIAYTASEFVTVKVLAIGIGYSCCGELICKKGKKQVCMFYKPDTDVEEHLRVLIINFCGGERMIHRFIKENGDQIRQIYALITVNYGVTERHVQSSYRCDREHIGGHKFVFERFTMADIGKQVCYK